MHPDMSTTNIMASSSKPSVKLTALELPTMTKYDNIKNT